MTNPDPTAPVLECRKLSVSYGSRAGPVPAVVDFNLTIRRGEAHGLVGESGCGKSTVALAIMRYLGATGRIVGGQVLFEGRDLLAVQGEALRRIRGAAIAMIYQEPMASLNPGLTVGEQLIEVPLIHAGVGRREAGARARVMLERVRLADGERIMRSYPHQISGGQQQRIVIAMALLANPRLLLLDEPTTALDVTVEAGIVDLIRTLAAETGTAMLYISHNLGLVRETCDRVTVMYAGQVVETGPIAAIFSARRHPYTQGLFAAIPSLAADKRLRPLAGIPGQPPPPRARPTGCVFGPRCGWFTAGRCDAGPVALEGREHATRCLRADEIDWEAPPRDARERPAAAVGEVVLAVSDLSKRYGEVVANDGLSFTARRGETVAIVGESGCGKSTLARIVMGLTAATSGSVSFAGLELSQRPVTRRDTATIRALQMVFQHPYETLNPSHTIGAQIARVIRLFGIERDETRIAQRVGELLDLVQLPREFAQRLPRQLSGGQKQRVGVARAFAGKPTLVIADEPLSALDVSVQAAVTELLLDMQRLEGTTLLFISHDLSVVRYLADRVVVMYLGQVMEQGSTAQVFAPPYHPYTEALLAAVPLADRRVVKRKLLLAGDVPATTVRGDGCPFWTRCSRRIAGTCEDQPAPVQEFASGHRIACHLPREQLLAMQPVFSIAEEVP